MKDVSKKDFKITQFDARTISWWRTRRTKIDLDPPYQRRGRLWSDTDKAYLIDSILNGYDVPKLYMADFTWGDSSLNKKKLPYAIIDGKQRLEAIFDFFDGKITLNDDFIYLENPAFPLAGLSYQDMQRNYPEVAEEFDNYNLLVMSVSAQEERPINELFVRLNRSKALTGAEVRNAMSGPGPKVIRHISHHNFFRDNVLFTGKRGQDLNAAAKVLMFEHYEKLIETKKRNLDAFVKKMDKKKSARLELSGRRVLDILGNMSEIFLPKDRLLASAGVFPVYFWLVRNTSEPYFHRVREFLVQFEKARKENRLLISANPNDVKIDRELVGYDGFNRSTNDQQSHEGRYAILKKRFGQLRNYHAAP
ncbi:MAG: DUF262 domain-containing protein [bacterium]|nr:DUF262 domain-containing protein [bacterium]